MFCWAPCTLFLRRDITWPGSEAPNTELPATMQFAPAEAATSTVEGPKPPSTCEIKHIFQLVVASHMHRDQCFSIIGEGVSRDHSLEYVGPTHAVTVRERFHETIS